MMHRDFIRRGNPRFWRLRWRIRAILYRAGLGGCPECGMRIMHKLSCDWEARERDGRN